MHYGNEVLQPRRLLFGRRGRESLSFRLVTGEQSLVYGQDQRPPGLEGKQTMTIEKQPADNATMETGVTRTGMAMDHADRVVQSSAEDPDTQHAQFPLTAVCCPGLIGKNYSIVHVLRSFAVFASNGCTPCDTCCDAAARRSPAWWLQYGLS